MPQTKKTTLRRLAAAFAIAAAGVLAVPAPAQPYMGEDHIVYEDRETQQALSNAYIAMFQNNVSDATIRLSMDVFARAFGHPERALEQMAGGYMMTLAAQYPSHTERVLMLLEHSPRSLWRDGGMAGQVAGLRLDDVTAPRAISLLRARIDESDRFLVSSIAYGVVRIAENFPAEIPTALDILRTLAQSPVAESRESAGRQLGIIAAQTAATGTAMDLLEILAQDNSASVSNSVMQALGRIGATNPAQAPRVVALLDQFIANGDEDLRGRARRALATVGMGNPAYTAHAMNALAQGAQAAGAEERFTTADILMTTGRNAALKAQSVAILAPLLNDAENRVAIRAATSLADIADGIPAYAAPLLQAIDILANGPIHANRTAALNAIGELATTSAADVPALLDLTSVLLARAVANNDSNVMNRTPITLQAIGIQHPARVDHILRILQGPAFTTNANFYVNGVTAQTALALRIPAVAATVRDYLIAQIPTVPDAGNPLPKTFESLGQIGAMDDMQAAAVVPVLVDQTRTGRNAAVNAAARALGEIGAQRPRQAQTVLTTLQALAAQPGHPSHIAVVGALGTLTGGDERLIDPVFMTFRSLVPGGSTALHNALGTALLAIAERHSRHAGTAMEVMEEIMNLPQNRNNYSLRNTLRRIGDIQQLYIINNHAQIRQVMENDLAAATADAALAERMMTNVQALVRAHDPVTRRRAVEIAGQLGRAHVGLAAAAVTVATGTAADGDPGVRLASTQTLGMVGMQHGDVAGAALPPLAALANDPDSMIAGLAVNAVGMIGARNPALAQDAADILGPHRQNANPLVRGNAENHLRNLPAPRAEGALPPPAAPVVPAPPRL